MTYKFMEHTADVKFLAEGKTLEEAFLESALALKEVMAGDMTVLSQKKKQIKVKGNDLSSLLYNFLEEIIFLLDAENFLLASIQELKIDEEKLVLSAVAFGDSADRYHFTNDVKAVTYNEMKIKFDEKDKIWSCQVVLDV